MGSLGCHLQQERKQMLVVKAADAPESGQLGPHLQVLWVPALRYGLEIPEHRALLHSGHPPSLHPIRSWHRQQDLWKYDRALPLTWLFTGEINRENQLNRCLDERSSPGRHMQ